MIQMNISMKQNRVVAKEGREGWRGSLELADAIYYI